MKYNRNYRTLGKTRCTKGWKHWTIWSDEWKPPNSHCEIIQNCGNHIISWSRLSIWKLSQERTLCSYSCRQASPQTPTPAITKQSQKTDSKAYTKALIKTHTKVFTKNSHEIKWNYKNITHPKHLPSKWQTNKSSSQPRWTELICSSARF